MKNKLLSTLLVPIAFIATSCNTNKKETQIDIKNAQSFVIEVDYDSEIKYLDGSNSRSLITCKTTVIVSLTENSYNLDVTTNCVNTYESEEFTNEYATNYHFKKVNDKVYGNFTDSTDSTQPYWVIDEAAYEVSFEALNFAETFKNKEDIKSLLEKMENGISEEKDSNQNYLLTEEFIGYIKPSFDYYIGFDMLLDNAKVENELSYFDASSNSFILEYSPSYSCALEDGSLENKTNMNVKIHEFSKDTKAIQAPEKDFIIDGEPINGSFTSGFNVLEIDTYLGVSNLTFRYKNENDEDYFFMYLENSSILKYGVTCEVTVVDAAGWNGAILGDSTPYYEYFLTHTSYELTVYEDGSFKLNVPTLEEILKWYNDNN